MGLARSFISFLNSTWSIQIHFLIHTWLLLNSDRAHSSNEVLFFSEQNNKDQSKKYPVENNVNMITVHQAICPTRQTHPNDQRQV